MAYMSQEKKKNIAPKVKAILKKYKMNGTLSVRSHMTLVLTIKSGALDPIKNYNETVALMPGFGQRRDIEPATKSLQPNPYHFKDHYTGKVKSFLSEIFAAMNEGNHDRSDIMTDYFDVGWYVDVNIGTWDKPYVVVT